MVLLDGLRVGADELLPFDSEHVDWQAFLEVIGADFDQGDEGLAFLGVVDDVMAAPALGVLEFAGIVLAQLKLLDAAQVVVSDGGDAEVGPLEDGRLARKGVGLHGRGGPLDQGPGEFPAADGDVDPVVERRSVLHVSGTQSKGPAGGDRDQSWAGVLWFVAWKAPEQGANEASSRVADELEWRAGDALDEPCDKSTRCDGITGENGLAPKGCGESVGGRNPDEEH